MNTVTESTTAAPPDAYAVFCGPINEDSARDLISNLATATTRKQNVHLLFQSSGGSAGDGVCLYNFFRALPIELTIYNVGSVCSAGVTAYLGARRRITSARAVFMIHRVTTRPGDVMGVIIPGITKNLVLNDDRCESILKENVTLLGGEKWSNLDYYDFFFSGKEAVDMGLAHEIGEFTPPPRTSVYHFFSQHEGQPKS
jgi:ATP-dependent Clp protease protease subunit